jgi:hypothetical protein
MTTTQTDDALAKQRREIQNVVDAVWRLLVDLTVEEKRLATDELNKWVTLEEASHQMPQ